MKTIIENVIKKGDYDLDKIIEKIDILFVEGKLTLDEKNDLCELARVDPKPQYDVKKEIENLWLAIKALKNDGSENENDEIIMEWVQPTGAHNAYNEGDRMIFDGKIYKSLINGNVWSPVSYPSAWEIEK